MKLVFPGCDQDKLKLNDVFSLEVTTKTDEKFLVQKSRNSEE